MREPGLWISSRQKLAAKHVTVAASPNNSDVWFPFYVNGTAFEILFHWRNLENVLYNEEQF